MLETPDLSKEFHPQPKVYRTKKPAKGLNKIGAKGKSNLSAVETLKKQFAAWGITKCELHLAKCWRTNALTFAHDDKRRYLTEDDIKDPSHVALICTPCHMEIEVMPREEMKAIIQNIVKNREIQK